MTEGRHNADSFHLYSEVSSCGDYQRNAINCNNPTIYLDLLLYNSSLNKKRIWYVYSIILSVCYQTAITWCIEILFCQITITKNKCSLPKIDKYELYAYRL